MTVGDPLGVSGPTPDAQRVIADVLHKHRWDSTPVRISEYPQCACGQSFRYRTDHDAHVSAAVVAALGGLTPETADVPESYETGRELPNPFVNGPDMIPEQRFRFIPSTRWVGGWIPKEAE